MENIIDLKEIILEKVKVGTRQYISDLMREELKLEFIEDIITQTTIASFRTWCWSEKIEERSHDVHFRYPKTWWQMFKFQYFPKRFLKKYPVQFENVKKRVTFSKTAAYPQLPIYLKGKTGRMVVSTELLEGYTSDLFEDEKVY